MNVWIMNLLDNRSEEDKPKDLQKSKFQFCKERGIIGIGWVGYDPEDSEDIGFLRANNAISAFKKDDLVWIKNPDSNEYYICRVTGEVLAAHGTELNRHDIGKFCPCDFIGVGTEESLPQGILKEDLISRATISKANSTVSEITQAYVNTRNSPTPPVLQVQTPPAQPTETQPKQEKKKPNIKKIVRILIIPLLILAIILIGSAVYKGMHPVLPYDNVKLGDTLSEVKAKISYTSEKTMSNEEREWVVLVEEFSESGVHNTDHFYPRLHIPFTANNGEEVSGEISYIFNDAEELDLIEISFDCPFPDERMLEVIDYYKAALGTKDYSLETERSEDDPAKDKLLETRKYFAKFQEDGYSVSITCVTIDIPSAKNYIPSGNILIYIGRDSASKS